MSTAFTSEVIGGQNVDLMTIKGKMNISDITEETEGGVEGSVMSREVDLYDQSIPGQSFAQTASGWGPWSLGWEALTCVPVSRAFITLHPPAASEHRGKARSLTPTMSCGSFDDNIYSSGGRHYQMFWERVSHWWNKPPLRHLTTTKHVSHIVLWILLWTETELLSELNNTAGEGKKTHLSRTKYIYTSIIFTYSGFDLYSV